MSWNLFLDDIRDPSFLDEHTYVVARSVAEAIDLVIKNGMPKHIAFDHDLGLLGSQLAPTGYDFAKWLVNEDLDGYLSLEHLTWSIHSSNHCGADNINKLLSAFVINKYN